jgi:hypothetical protein
MSLRPEQFDVLQSLMGIASQAAHKLKIPIEYVEKFLENVKNFVLTNHRRIGVRPYIFLLSHLESGVSTINLQSVKGNINAGTPIFYVDADLKLYRSRQATIRLTECTDITRQEQLLGIYINDTRLWVCLCGDYIEDINLLDSEPGPAIISSSSRKASDLDKILDDHYESRIKDEKGFRYWKIKADRILLAGPDGTEDIFHRDLFWWLNTYVYDKLKVAAEVSGFGQDKVDIFIVTTNGTYVIEIKWLGRNENNTTYNEKTIDSALKQVKYYLDNDYDFVCGHIVVYDGRSHEKHLSESGFDDKSRHLLCTKPNIIFLESDTPSKKAKRKSEGKS